MATKIRLQRQGRKRRPIFHIVVTDSRAPRDGKYIERLGLYNPNTNPATIDLDFERSLHWLQVGAQPSDTAKAILSYKGVLHKDFLINGVKKGAHTLEQAEEKFTQWQETKESKISGKIDNLAAAQEAMAKANLEREIKMKEAMAAKVLAKNSPLAEEVAEVEAIESGQEMATETIMEATEESGAEIKEVEAEEITEEAAEQMDEVAEEVTDVVAESTEEPTEEIAEEVAVEIAESGAEKTEENA